MGQVRRGFHIWNFQRGHGCAERIPVWNLWFQRLGWRASDRGDGQYYQSEWNRGPPPRLGGGGELKRGETANIINPKGTAAPPQVSVAGANSVVVDPGGWFVYASGTKGIYAFQIDPENGSLVQVSGSPVAANGVSQIVMDPSGNYLYAVSSSIATYR